MLKPTLSQYPFLAMAVIFFCWGCGQSKPSQNRVQDVRIVFFGDSLTAGLGVEPHEKYSSLIEKRLKPTHPSAHIINAGISGDTSSDGLARVDQILDPPPDIFILALGANDMIRKEPAFMLEKNLSEILDRVIQKNHQATLIVAGVDFGIVLGLFVRDDYKTAFLNVSKKYNTLFIPSLLKGVVGNPELNTQDGIHPNAKGHEKIAETVWDILKDAL